MEIMRIQIQLTQTIAVDGGEKRVQMILFTGETQSKLFRGHVLPGGVDTQEYTAAGQGGLSARYMLEGEDCEGQSCRLYIDNRAAVRPGTQTVTSPRITTDSRALRWLETAALTGRIEETGDGLDIVISREDEPHARPVVLHRAGLTLRGRLERRTEKPCPLVLMLHGFGGDMCTAPGSLMQEISDRLTDRGLATLRFDFNGHGSSDGNFTEMTPYNEIEDAAVFLNWARRQEDVTDICVLGHSQGGVVGGMLAGYYADMVKKLVLLAPAACLKTDAQQGKCMQAVYDPRSIPYSVNVDGRHDVGGLFFRMAQTLPIYEVTSLFPHPALVVCGGKDLVVTEEGGRKYMEGLRKGEFVLYPGLDHGLGGPEWEEMLAKVVGFLS